RAVVRVPLSNVYSIRSPFNPPCSLWLFSAFSVLNSENLNTEATENHRATEPEPKMCARSKHFDGQLCKLPSARTLNARIAQRKLKPARLDRGSRAGPFTVRRKRPT